MAGGRAIENGVAREDVATAGSVGTSGDGDGPAGETLADVVVGFAVELEVDAGAEERTKTLASAEINNIAGDPMPALLL